ncbi:molybdopterin molybdotransferase MoeA [Azospirillum sp. RWY-5-1]|uniref:Molybdopterin molybdenumtransferase n=1 Tax=Azospirillum oleiclasticum TaxID=2735135 RepID=A0ABX2TN36_9PROT|nr:gephyrin-like molybdotransferase Glp [Azospirillum oleiclasticum]NYZ16967.1 molybdopterin molybdotransferase MoeA [Azospirillum oleiclasticum]NYZ24590.1 molybdopterin molybdotransferase MoeA [Azospirillum oleiclasticum]
MTVDALPVEEALARILDGLRPLPAEIVPLTDGLGRVLAEPVVARLTQPPFANAAMDGWAVRSADLASASEDRPVRLRRIGESAAGNAYAGTVGPQETVRIFTGAPMPDGADAVVMQEDARDLGDAVELVHPVQAGRFVRPAGLDFQAGTVLLPAGRRLTARDVGLAAAAGWPWLRVRRRPRVAILPTGDEVALPGEPLGPHQIVSSNAIALAAMVATQGGIAVNLGIAADEAGRLSDLAAGAAGADLLVTSGGAAAGAHDHVRGLLDGPPVVSRVAMRPGGGLVFGWTGGVPLLGLPGNPVSTGIAAVLFLIPILRALQGLPPGPVVGTATLGAPLRANPGRRDHIRARLEVALSGSAVATPLDRQDNAQMSGFAAADALIVRPAGAPAGKAGAVVEIIALSGGCLDL